MISMTIFRLVSSELPSNKSVKIISKYSYSQNALSFLILSTFQMTILPTPKLKLLLWA
jgi:hypothetical protein